ncbi:hypothetical protein ABTC40_19465, partial [Acinetobacter baumannii]
LHRVQLDGADLLLERDAEGRPNWVFAPSISAEAPPAAPAASRGPSRRFALHLDRLLLTEAAIGWRGAPAQPVRTLSIRRLEVEPKGAGDGL